jgi:hypothetical protein
MPSALSNVVNFIFSAISSGRGSSTQYLVNVSTTTIILLFPVVDVGKPEEKKLIKKSPSWG